jgi:hypothetical protein
MIASQTFDCTGEIALGELAPATVRRLAELGGDWLEFDPRGGRVVVRHVQPEGAPAISAVPAELIAILAALAPEERQRVRGGTLVVRERPGVALRLSVEAGEIRVQWPREDWTHAIEVPVEEALAAVVPATARVSGQVRFTAPPGARAELVDFVERFEGLYPEGDLRLDRDGAEVRVELRGLNVGPAELLTKLRALAKPPASLAGALDVSSFVPNALERDFRLTLAAGEASAARPALWRQD